MGIGLLVAGCDDVGGIDAASAGTSGSGAEAGSNVGGATNSGGAAGNAGDASGAGGTVTTGGAGGSDGSSGGTGAAGAGGIATTGGMSGMGGAGGTAGSAGGASGVGGTSGAAGTGDCVDFSRIETGSRDLRVIGTGFDESDGDTVRLVVTNGTPRNDPSHGLAETLIRSGSFEIALPDAIGIYWGLGVYIDKGKDDACTLDDDPFWQMTTGATFDEVILEITPSLEPDVNPPCNINAIFDLTQPLPCSN